MLVRLAAAWTDPYGIRHGAGDLVDIDAITLAELEQRGVVENVTENPSTAWTGPTSPKPDDDPDNAWTGPTSPKPDDDPDNAWTGPTSDEPDEN